MKTLFTLLTLIFGATFFSNFLYKNEYNSNKKLFKADTLVLLMGEAKTIIESKCLPCHGNITFMPEARARFNLDSINYLPLNKKVAKLDDMIYILEKGAMPHQRFMEIRPDGILTYAEKKAIESWADKTAVRLTRPRGSQDQK